MTEVSFYPAFIKTFKKKAKNNPILIKNFQEKLEIFIINPFDPRLKTHKLSGELKDFYSFSLDYDNRIIFSFYDKQKVIFEHFGFMTKYIKFL